MRFTSLYLGLSILTKVANITKFQVIQLQRKPKRITPPKHRWQPYVAFERSLKFNEIFSDLYEEGITQLNRPSKLQRYMVFNGKETTIIAIEVIVPSYKDIMT